MGDLVRECLLTLSEEGLFTKEGPSDALITHGSLTTSQVSSFERQVLN